MPFAALRSHARRSPVPDAATAWLGPYPLLSVLGRGSMGIVYRSFDPHRRCNVAVKTLRDDLTDHPQENFAQRLQLEAQISRRLAHPGIVAVHDFGMHAGRPYLVMDPVEGRSLQRHLAQPVEFALAQAGDLIAQLLTALQHAHDRGVWHRDVKPSNILITPEGRVKLTDFGIACLASRSSPDGARPELDDIMGTAGYVAPETYLTDRYDGRVDVFAAGAVLYRLLSGVAPFTGSAHDIMFKVCYETPLPPSTAAGQSRLKACDRIVLRALARRPEERYASPHEFLQALRTWPSLRLSATGR